MRRAERPQHENSAPGLAEGERSSSQRDAQKYGDLSARSQPRTTSTEARLPAVSRKKTHPSLCVYLSFIVCGLVPHFVCGPTTSDQASWWCKTHLGCDFFVSVLPLHEFRGTCWHSVWERGSSVFITHVKVTSFSSLSCKGGMETETQQHVGRPLAFPH